MDCCIRSRCYGIVLGYKLPCNQTRAQSQHKTKLFKEILESAAFLKAVLKNLLPKADEVFDVMDGRQELHLVKQIGKLFLRLVLNCN